MGADAASVWPVPCKAGLGKNRRPSRARVGQRRENSSHIPLACSGPAGFGNSGAMSRQSRAARLNVEPSYPAWKADAVKALQRLHAPAATVTPERVGRSSTSGASNRQRRQSMPSASTSAPGHPHGWRRGRRANQSVGRPCFCNSLSRRSARSSQLAAILISISRCSTSIVRRANARHSSACWRNCETLIMVRIRAVLASPCTRQRPRRGASDFALLPVFQQ